MSKQLIQTYQDLWQQSTGWGCVIESGTNEYGNWINAKIKPTPKSTPIQSTYRYYGPGCNYSTLNFALDALDDWFENLMRDSNSST